MWQIFVCMLLGLSLTNGGSDSSPFEFGKANEKFSGKFLSEVLHINQDKNVIVSAYSVMFPLTQLSMASVDDSRKEILTALGLPDDDAGVKKAFKDTTRALENVKGVTLKIANKIYVAQESELNENFVKETKDVFNSKIEKVDFNEKQATAKKINLWVESKTNNRIKDLVSADNLSELTRVMLVNAIYFRGRWKKEFLTKDTKNRDFHVTKSKTIQVPMMHKVDFYKYGESEILKAQLLELPYEGGETSLLVVLPTEVDGVNDLVEKLKDPKNLENAVSTMNLRQVDIHLPKFKIETKTDLKEVLQKMGINKIFTIDARLNNLLKGSSEELQVDSAIQKAYIEVNEEGTEAAAANEHKMIMLLNAFSPTEPIKFWATNPFYFAIVNHKQNITYFSGIVVKPRCRKYKINI